MSRLTQCARKDNVCAIQQLFDRAAMEKLHDEVLVQDWPETPNLMKHDNQKTARFGFAVDQGANEIVRITGAIEAISAVLHEYFAAGGRQLLQDRLRPATAGDLWNEQPHIRKRRPVGEQF